MRALHHQWQDANTTGPGSFAQRDTFASSHPQGTLGQSIQPIHIYGARFKSPESPPRIQPQSLDVYVYEAATNNSSQSSKVPHQARPLLDLERMRLPHTQPRMASRGPHIQPHMARRGPWCFLPALSILMAVAPASPVGIAEGAQTPRPVSGVNASIYNHTASPQDRRGKISSSTSFGSAPPSTGAAVQTCATEPFVFADVTGQNCHGLQKYRDAQNKDDCAQQCCSMDPSECMLWSVEGPWGHT